MQNIVLQRTGLLNVFPQDCHSNKGIGHRNGNLTYGVAIFQKIANCFCNPSKSKSICFVFSASVPGFICDLSWHNPEAARRLLPTARSRWLARVGRNADPGLKLVMVHLSACALYGFPIYDCGTKNASQCTKKRVATATTLEIFAMATTMASQRALVVLQEGGLRLLVSEPPALN